MASGEFSEIPSRYVIGRYKKDAKKMRGQQEICEKEMKKELLAYIQIGKQQKISNKKIIEELGHTNNALHYFLIKL